MSELELKNVLVDDESLDESLNEADYDELDIDGELERILKRLDEVTGATGELSSTPAVPVVTARPAVPVNGPVEDVSSTILLTERVDFTNQVEDETIEELDSLEPDSPERLHFPGASTEATSDVPTTGTVSQLTPIQLARLIETAVEQGVRRAMNR